MSQLRSILEGTAARGEKALIGFILAALPDEQISLEIIKTLAKEGCDIIELGVPFTDPLADGAVIERFHHRGTAMGLNLTRTLDFVRKARAVVDIPIVLFCYYNPIYQRGLSSFGQAFHNAGLDGLIVPDLPLDEMSGYDPTFNLIPMVAPSSSDERLSIAAAMKPAFLYCVSVKGVTGAREDFGQDEIEAYLSRVRRFTQAPLALGFGISKARHIHRFKPYVDAFIVGSHFARIIEQYEHEPDQMIQTLAQETRKLKAACSSQEDGKQ